MTTAQLICYYILIQKQNKSLQQLESFSWLQYRTVAKSSTFKFGMWFTNYL